MMPKASSSLPGASYTLPPSSGENIDDIRAGIFRLYTKYPTARPGNVKMTHMWMPKW